VPPGALGDHVGPELHLCAFNRLIKKHDLNVIYITGPGHGDPGLVANTYLEGTYSEIYPHISQDEAVLQRLFKQFSFPGGSPSHVAPETPGSINEGGELGYSLAHAYEEGTTTTPFDMAVLNDIDRFHLVGDVIDRVPHLGAKAAYVKQAMRDKRIEHTQYIIEHGEALPEVRNWTWGAS
jgi:phosphoketolase